LLIIVELLNCVFLGKVHIIINILGSDAISCLVIVKGSVDRLEDAEHRVAVPL